MIIVTESYFKKRRVTIYIIVALKGFVSISVKDQAVYSDVRET